MKSLKLIPLASALMAAGLSATVLAAPAGRADFATGDVSVRMGTGAERKLVKGAEIQSGETIRTGADGRVQLRMTDDSYMSLVPNTQFTIADYKFEGRTDGNESATYNLVRGALRTVTGLIGRANRDKYRLVTPTATVGIRGTGGEISVTETETRIRGTSGQWIMTNQFGTLEVPAGTSGVASFNAPPTQTSTPPNVSAPPATSSGTTSTVETTPSQGDQRSGATNVSGVPSQPPQPPVVLRPTPLPAAGPYNLNSEGLALLDPLQTKSTDFIGIGGFFVDSVASPSTIRRNGYTYTFNPNVSLDLTPATVATVEFTKGTATLSDVGALTPLGIDLYWGRFTNGTVKVTLTENGVLTSTVNRTLTANQGVHAVYGTPTALTAMPTSGSAAFTFVGGTKPTTFDGSAAPLQVSSASLNVNFATGSAQMGFVVVNPTVSYTASGTASVNGNGLNGFLGVTSPTGSIQGGAPCTASTCGASVNGAFYGASANAMGASFSILRTDRTATNSIDGTIVFRR